MPRNRPLQIRLLILSTLLVLAAGPGIVRAQDPAHYFGMEGHGAVLSSRQTAENTTEALVALDDGRILKVQTVVDPQSSAIVSKNVAIISNPDLEKRSNP